MSFKSSKSILSLALTGLHKEDRLNHFQRIYNEYNVYVRKTIYWMGCRDSIDDLVQETFLKVWRNLHNFRGEAKIKTWIHKITKNVVIDHLRKNKITIELTNESSNSENFEIKQVIRIGINRLSPKLRICFILYYKQGFKIEEISKLEGIPIGTVKSRLHNARSEFTLFLKAQGVTYE